ncbi:MAG: hypothetical protein Q4P20_01320 [Eubacteriales bacterium]|nr:hypothetical protein [Eubacteriales bacterium]
MNEETFFGQLVYIGDDLMLGNMLCTDLIDFSAIVAAAEDMFISVVEKRFKIQFMFRLYDKIQVTDHTKKIAEIKQKIQQYHEVNET